MPKLSRSNLHRCLQYHGLSRLPKEDDEGKVKHKPFNAYPIGYVHIDITELLCGSGKY